MLKRNELLLISKQIAADVLAAGLPLDTLSVRSLESLTACEVGADSRWQDVSIGFSVGRESTWHNSARIEFRGRSGREDRYGHTDDEGNFVTNFSISVSFHAPPGLGEAWDLEEAEAQLDLAMKCLKLTKELKAKYDGTIQYISRTAAENAEFKAMQECEELITKIKCFAEDLDADDFTGLTGQMTLARIAADLRDIAVAHGLEVPKPEKTEKAEGR